MALLLELECRQFVDGRFALITEFLLETVFCPKRYNPGQLAPFPSLSL